MNIDRWIAILSIPIGLLGGFIFAYYGKPLSDLREGAVLRHSMKKEERELLDQQRIGFFRDHPTAFNRHLIILLYHVILAFGMLMLAMFAAVLGFITQLPHPQLGLVNLPNMSRIGFWVLETTSLVCLGFGATRLRTLTNEWNRIFKALLKVTSEHS